jgi:acetyl esterase/lipase
LKKKYMKNNVGQVDAVRVPRAVVQPKGALVGGVALVLPGGAHVHGGVVDGASLFDFF